MQEARRFVGTVYYLFIYYPAEKNLVVAIDNSLRLLDKR